MARYIDAIDTPVPIEQAFDYLADFSRTAEWDPGVASAKRLSAGEIQVGSRFLVNTSVFGTVLKLEFEIIEFDRPSRLVFTGGDGTIESTDEITFVSKPGGTRITYEARLKLTGFRQFADPVLHLLFQRVGQVAVRGLRERLSAEHDTASSSPKRPA